MTPEESEKLREPARYTVVRDWAHFWLPGVWDKMNGEFVYFGWTENAAEECAYWWNVYEVRRRCRRALETVRDIRRRRDHRRRM